MSESKSDHQIQCNAVQNVADAQDQGQTQAKRHDEASPSVSTLTLHPNLPIPSVSAPALASTSTSITQNKAHKQNVSKQNQNPQIFKLNTDCFDEIFEWLSQEDLDALGQTCKVMRLVTGEYFQRTFPALPATVGDDGLYVSNSSKSLSSRTPSKLHSFDKLIQKISISENMHSVTDGVGMFSYVASNCMKSVKHIQFRSIYLGQMELEWIGEMLKTIETITIEDCVLQKPFYENFPKLCVNVKSLSVKGCQFGRSAVFDEDSKEWLRHKYPKLEHFAWQTDWHFFKNEFKTFFELNRNIRSFSITLNSLIYYILDRKNGTLSEEFDDLTIEVDDWDEDLQTDPDICSELNRLYDLGAYKRLHIISDYFVDGFFSKMKSLRGLYSLSLQKINNRYALPKLDQLKELNIRYIDLDLSPELVEENEYISNLFKNIERVHFKFLNYIHLIPFLYFSPKLKAVKMDIILDRHRFMSCINLEEIHLRREKLLNARKVTIYVDDNVYVATKWMSPTIEFKYVEIKRANAEEWNHLMEFD